MLEPSEEATPTVSVVVPTYRRPDALATTLDALLRVDFPKTGYEIVVVDDGSDATTEEVVTGLDAGDVAVQYIPQANSGAASARNTGARAAKGELLLFCDDDIILEPDHLRLQVATRGVYGDPVVNGVTHFSDRAVAILRETPFGRYRLDLDRTYQDAADGPLLGNDCYEAPLLSACNLAISRDRFWEIGGFDEAFPFAGAEDQALSLRARAA